MIELSESHAAKMSGTNRLICLEALKRGWKLSMPHLASSHFYIDRGDGKQLHMFSSTPPTISYASAHLVDDKYSTYLRLQYHGIDQLKTRFYNNAEGIGPVLELMNQTGRVVVKPLDSGHGKGITVNVTTEKQLKQAIDIAAKSNKSLKGALVQEQLVAKKLHDLRILTIDKKFVAAIERVPARVHGDGVSTVEQLIKLENDKPVRGTPYRAKLAVIDEAAVHRYLGERIHEIPQPGEEVLVLGVANYGTGGELLDITDDIPDWMKAEAEKASAGLDLDLAGIDYMTTEPISAHVMRDSFTAVIVEVNKCPSLAIHDEPTVGSSRHVTEKYLDFIEKL